MFYIRLSLGNNGHGGSSPGYPGASQPNNYCPRRLASPSWAVTLSRSPALLVHGFPSGIAIIFGFSFDRADKGLMMRIDALLAASATTLRKESVRRSVSLLTILSCPAFALLVRFTNLAIILFPVLGL